jgi:hypothetical protein
MPIHFVIDEPRTTPPYDPTTETVFVKGTYSGAKPTTMWCVAADGAAPGATHNPFEAGATEFMAMNAGKWEATGPAIAGDGVKHVRIWSIQPGSLEIAFDDREYSVVTPGPAPPATPATTTAARMVSANKASASSKSGAQPQASTKGSKARASLNGTPAKPAAKPAKRGGGKGKAARPKAAAASRGKGRLTPTKGKPKAPKAGKRKRAR